MGGYINTPGVKLHATTVLERDRPEDHDRLRKLTLYVAEMERHITAQEVAILKTDNESEINMRRTEVNMVHAKMKEYRAEIARLDEGNLN